MDRLFVSSFSCVALHAHLSRFSSVHHRLPNQGYHSNVGEKERQNHTLDGLRSYLSASCWDQQRLLLNWQAARSWGNVHATFGYVPHHQWIDVSHPSALDLSQFLLNGLHAGWLLPNEPCRDRLLPDGPL